jgi:hypothetical protein
VTTYYPIVIEAEASGAVNDPLLMRGFERLRDLFGDRQRLVEGDRATGNAR